LNIGTRLYQKGVKKQEERERFVREEQARAEKRQEEGLVFRPQLVTKHREKS
jgi:hypothetical protein